MKEFVRAAIAADLPRLVELYQGCIAGARATRGADMFAVREAFAPPFEEKIANYLASPEHLAYVGGIDDVVLGMALVSVETLRSGPKHAVVDALYVEEEARAVGVGEMLMEEIVTWSRGVGAISIDAPALPGDRDTKNFFEMSGFTARLLVMHHKLTP